MSSENIHLEVNEYGLEQLSMDFLTISDNISIILDQIDEKFQTLKDYLKCDSMDEITNKYENIKNNFTIIKDNVISYSDDMVILNRKTSIEGAQRLTNIINNSSDNVTTSGNSKLQEIEKEL